MFGLDCPSQVPTQCIAYVDDICKPVICHAGQVVDSLQFITKIVVEVFKWHGFTPNFSAGKTEAVVAFAGQGARQMQKHILCTCGGVLHFDGVGLR
eukprot:2260252-Karenia_brevis.AAC.1